MTFQKGRENPNWRGGVADYPNHAEMKRQRLRKLKQTRGRCEVCRLRANTIHHINGDKSDHAIENLVALCHKCHRVLEPGGRPLTKTSRYIRLYGMTSKKIAEVIGCKITDIYRWHREGTLDKCLQEAQKSQVIRLQNQSEA